MKRQFYLLKGRPGQFRAMTLGVVKKTERLRERIRERVRVRQRV